MNKRSIANEVLNAIYLRCYTQDMAFVLRKI